MAAKKTVPGIAVKSARDGFRRGGRAWSKESVELPLTAFTKEQLAQIESEPLLTVIKVSIDVAE